MHCIVRRVASSMGAAMKMLITVALGMGLISDIARAAEKPVYLSCHGKRPTGHPGRANRIGVQFSRQQSAREPETGGRPPSVRPWTQACIN